MNLNRTSLFLLRQLDPETADGRAALQQLTQKDVDTIREKFLEPPLVVAMGAWALTFLTSIWLFCVVGILALALFFSFGMFLFSEQPISPNPVEAFFSFESWRFWAAAAAALAINLAGRRIVHKTNFVESFKPMGESKLVERALSVAKEHPETIAYQRQVSSRREFICADANALIEIAKRSRKEELRAVEKRKEIDRKQKIQEAIQELQNGAPALGGAGQSKTKSL